MAGDTLQGMSELAQRCPRVFAVKAVVDECLKLLRGAQACRRRVLTKQPKVGPERIVGQA